MREVINVSGNVSNYISCNLVMVQDNCLKFGTARICTLDSLDTNLHFIMWYGYSDIQATTKQV